VLLPIWKRDLLVGAKHLEDKLSVIAKNSSPNASPVQLSVVNGEEKYSLFPLSNNFQNCCLRYLPFEEKSDKLYLCVRRKFKKRLGWKHGNTPRRFLMSKIFL